MFSKMMVGGLKALGLGTAVSKTCATLHNASGQTQVKKQESYAQLGECKACSGLMLWHAMDVVIIYDQSVFSNMAISSIRSDCRWVPR